MSKVGLALETLTDLASALLKGEGVVSGKEVWEHRLEICSECPFMKGSKCEACGCNISLKAKVATAKCPRGFWESKVLEKVMYGEVESFETEKCCK